MIVTGTRVTGMTAADSAAPITVIGSDALTHVGQPNLIQALSQLTPSFSAEAIGGDTGALTLSARLRGLSPNDTLVLVNGKRRHSTGNLHVLGGQYQGAATADLDLIPVAAIDHVEVLQEGAAAQYGTDAIAGVVNIILKKNDSGGLIYGTAGQYQDEGGQTYDFSGNIGFPLGDKGFLNVTAEKRYRGFSQRGAQDIRVMNANGVANGAYNATLVPGYPNINHITGDPQSMLTTVAANMEYAITPDVTFYANATYGEREAKAFENVRLPSRVTAAAGSADPCSAANPNGYSTAQTAGGGAACAIGIGGGVVAIAGSVAATPGRNAQGIIIASGSKGTPGAAGTLVPFPNGFNPQEALREDDYGYSMGFKGDLNGWHWDLSGSYGKDRDGIYTLNTANAALFVDTHTTPRNIYDGQFTATELTFNLDLSKEFDVGFATPLTVAFGADPTVTFTGVTLLLNGPSTLTQGIDVSANYVTDFGPAGNVTWTFAGNYNDTSISKIIPTPAALGPGVVLFDQTSRTTLTNASPREKIGLSALWDWSDWSVNLRETLYGPSSYDAMPDGATYYRQKVSTAFITDAELDYHYGENWTFAFGANNLFNKYPEAIGVVPGDPTTLQDGSNIVGAPLSISPYGINGGFYYTRLTFNF